MSHEISSTRRTTCSLDPFIVVVSALKRLAMFWYMLKTENLLQPNCYTVMQSGGRGGYGTQGHFNPAFIQGSGTTNSGGGGQ